MARTSIALELERRLAVAAIRAAARRPLRRLVWVALAVAVVWTIVTDADTSAVVARDLGAWSPSVPLVAAVAVAILLVAGAVGARTPAAYGVRAADLTWWRLAGIGRREGEQAAALIAVLRAAVAVGLPALLVAWLFSLAAPARAGALFLLAGAAAVVAPLAVAVGAAAAPSDATEERRRPAARSQAAEAPRPFAVWSGAAPRGLFAARWLSARQRRQRLIPLLPPAFGIALGVVAVRAGDVLGGQAAALLAVFGPVAFLLDAAVRRTTGPDTFRSPWWRVALGTRPPAIAAWALAETLPTALGLGAAVLAAAVVAGTPLLGLAAALPVALAPAAVRLANVSVDVALPAGADRRGPGAVLRLAAVASLTVATVAFAWSAGAVTPFAAPVVVAAAELALALGATRWISERLPQVSA